MVQKTVEQLNLGFGLFEVSRKRAASNRDTRKWLSEMEIGLQSTKMGQIMFLTKFWVKCGQCGLESVPRLQLKCCKRNRQTDFGLSLCVCPVARGVWGGARVSCERSFHVALRHVAATQASLPSQWRRICNTLMKIPMNCQPQGPRCGRPWLAASNCVRVLIICRMTGRTDRRTDRRRTSRRTQMENAGSVATSFCFQFQFCCTVKMKLLFLTVW